MKKIASIAAVMLMAVVFVLAGCNSTPTPENSSTPATTSSTSSASETSSTEPQTDDSLQKVLDKGEFVLGLDDSLPPMGYRDDNNKIVGFDIDLATEVCKRMGVKLTPQPISWDAKEQELNTGKIDCIWNGLSIDEDRKATMNLSEPYMQNRMVLVVLDKSSYNDQASLNGKKVAVQNGSTAQKSLKAATQFYDTIEELGVQDNITAFMELETANVDAVFMDSTVAEYYIGQGKAYRILEDALTTPEDYAIGFRKNDQALRDKVQETMQEMKADGTLAKISNTWFGKDVTTVK